MDRPLSTAESALHHARTACVPNIGVAAIVDTVPAHEALVAAARALQQRHPLLRVVVRGGAKPRFVTVEKSTPIDVLDETLVTADRWLARLEVELARPFVIEHGPLVRVIVQRGDGRSVLIVVCDHVIGDGHALNVILDELIGYATGRPPTDGPRAELPPIDSLLPTWPGSKAVGQLAALSASLAAPAIRAMGMLAGPSSRPDPVRAARVHVWHRALDVEASAAIVETSRREGCTVFGALGAATLRAIAADARHGHRSVSMAVPVSLRDTVKPPVSAVELGVWAWAPSHVFALDRHQPFWPLARQVRDRVATTRDRTMLATAGLATRAWAPWIALPEVADWIDAAPRLADTQLVLSNLGRVDAPNVHALGLHAAAYTAMVPREDLVFIPATIDGRLQLTATWSDTSPIAATVPALMTSIAEELHVATR